MFGPLQYGTTSASSKLNLLPTVALRPYCCVRSFSIPYDISCSLLHRVGNRASSFRIDLGSAVPMGGVLTMSTCRAGTLTETNYGSVVALVAGCYGGAWEAQAQVVTRSSTVLRGQRMRRSLRLR